MTMTRTEAIDLIKSTATRLDDERVRVLLSVARTLAESERAGAVSKTTRALSPRELAEIERSKSDFAEGRVVDQRQYDAMMTDFMAELKAADERAP